MYGYEANACAASYTYLGRRIRGSRFQRETQCLNVVQMSAHTTDQLSNAEWPMADFTILVGNSMACGQADMSSSSCVLGLQNVAAY